MTAADGRRAIGVLIVTFDSERVLPGLLASLEAGMDEVEWRGVVVDNGSSDRTVEVARAHRPELRVVETGVNLGFAAAVNRGLADLAANDVLILNPDVRLPPGAASSLRSRLAGRLAGPRAARRGGIVAPRLVDADGRLSPSLRHEPSIGRALAETLLGVRLACRLGWGETIVDPGAYERPTSADWASGAALLISRETLAACGPWDESFFLYSEDAEYELRARDRGFPARLAPEVTATHLGGASRSEPRLWTLLAVNKAALYGKRHGPLRTVLFRAVAALRELRFAATGNRPSRRAAWALLTGSKPRR
jgi:N-acetylglucosaminyl-diphospho-decaprenol L-rhamnosyltransferase